MHDLETTWPTMKELPRLLSEVVATDPDGIALTRGTDTVTYRELHREVKALDAAMGILLGPASLVPIALATVLPDLAEARTGELHAAIDELVCGMLAGRSRHPLASTG